MSIFSKLGKFVGKAIHGLGGTVGKTVAGVVPGGAVVAAGLGGLGKLGKRVDRKVLKGAIIGAGAGTAALGGAEMMGGMFGRPRKRYRRMNPGNTRALGRAMRRIEAGARIFKRYYTIKHGGMRGAAGVRVKGRHRRAA